VNPPSPVVIPQVVIEVRPINPKRNFWLFHRRLDSDSR
jgi:hypothetical protein